MSHALTVLISCPHCGFWMLEYRVLSACLCWQRIWSDGKVLAPMYPKLPLIIKCPKCHHYFLQSQGNDVKGANIQPNEDTMPYTKHLSFDELIEAKPYVYDADRLLWFMTMWHAYNDIQRTGHKPTSDQKGVFTSEAEAFLLLDLFKVEGVDGIQLEAELHRELGHYDECILLLEMLPNKDKDRPMVRQIMQAALKHEDAMFEEAASLAGWKKRQEDEASFQKWMAEEQEKESLKPPSFSSKYDDRLYLIYWLTISPLWYYLVIRDEYLTVQEKAWKIIGLLLSPLFICLYIILICSL